MRRALVVVVLGVLLLGVAPAEADDGPWGWPLTGTREVSRAYDPPASRYAAGHRGADLPSAPGAVVRASAAGRVSYAGLLAGRGVVVVTHGALRTTYEPVTASVRLGQEVVLGQPVGTLAAGHAGCAAAACLHWGLRRGEDYLDPVRPVAGGPVRLLPLAAPAGSANGSLPAPGGALRRAGPGEAASSPGLRPPDAAPATAPSWSLRAAEAPLGAAAVVALVLGIGLLARPRPDPPAPVSGGGTLPAASITPDDEPAAGLGTVLDLESARVRRQAAS